jgi:ABC-type enterochelin transport system permease subunit
MALWTYVDAGEEKKSNSHYYWFFAGLLIAFFGSYYAWTHYYMIFPYSSLCFLGIHWHHLYTGAIMVLILLIIYKPIINKRPMAKLWLILLIGFAIGMLLEDVVSHWIVVDDPFIFYCSERLD